MIKKSVLFIILLLTHEGFTQVTVHVFNPWLHDTCAGHRDSLRMIGNSEVGYYPGTNMSPEGGGWFFYDYKNTHVTAHSLYLIFSVTTWCGPASFNDQVKYRYNISIDSLQGLYPYGTFEFWITIPDTSQPPCIYNYLPHGKVLHFFNTWPETSPKMVIGSNAPVQMRPEKGRCGWYTGYYGGLIDSLANVSFIDYYHTQKYTAAGLREGMGIDARPVLSAGDTVYILPKPAPDGLPVLSAVFPDTVGECLIRKIPACFYDWKCDSMLPNPSFLSGTQLMQLLDLSPRYDLTKGLKNAIQDSLSGPDYKPKKTTDTSVYTVALGHVETWFVTQAFGAGSSRATNDTIMDMPFKKSDCIGWEFNGDSSGEFFPLDSFINPNNIKEYAYHYKNTPNAKILDSALHNFRFAMEMHVRFVYRKDRNDRCYFQSDDDLWVFVNNRLAVDLGGIHPALDTVLYLDSVAKSLEIEDGKTYAMDIFYADRILESTCFKMRTTMDILASDETGLILTQNNIPAFRSFKTPIVSIPLKRTKSSAPFLSISGRKYNNTRLAPQPLIKIKSHTAY
jgi:fibro-slime domain-containing protein